MNAEPTARSLAVMETRKPVAGSRRTRNFLRLAIVAPAAAAVVLLFAGSAPPPAAQAAAEAVTAAPLPAGALAPAERHRRIARLSAQVIERSHFSQVKLDDKLSAEMLDRYLDLLDGNRSYFLASDVNEFATWRTQLDDAIRSGRIEPAFAIFQRYRERNRSALASALKSLATEPDFTVDESYTFDRAKSPWPTTQAELDDLWRRRVKNDALSLELTGKSWAEAQDLLRKRYERLQKRSEQVSADDVFEGFMNSLAHVYDPHSNYFSPRSSEEYNIAMRLSYQGIGASLQTVDDYVTIMNIIPGGPAAKSGQLKANDRITAVAQGKSGDMVDVVGWRLDDVVQLIRGPADSVVRLSILPGGASPGSKEVVQEYQRGTVTLEAQAAQKKPLRTIEDPGKVTKIGIIDVPSFYQDYDARAAGKQDYRSTTRDVERLVKELRAEGMQALVLDLRGNGGGLLTEAAGLVGLFVPEGPVVQLRETGGRTEVLDDPEPGVLWDGPLTVLVDRSSASASEIFAGAIQDYGRGLILGQQTFGKGTVQNMFQLDRWALGPDAGFGQLTVTIGKYYRISGESTQNRGVSPDISLPSFIDPTDMGESVMDYALPWDRIPAASAYHPPTTPLQAAATALNVAHTARLTHDPDLKALQGDLAAVTELRKEKSVSLNLAKRKTERDRLEAERLARENTRRAAHGEPALKDAEAMAAAEAPDAVLTEAVRITADWALMGGTGATLATPGKPRMVRTQPQQRAKANAG